MSQRSRNVPARFVIDTNVIVSALLSKQSISRLAFDRALEQGTLLLSVSTIEELSRVLGREGFNRYLLESERMRFLAALVREAVLVEVAETITVCRDPKDDKFLELAITAAATCIVSGDEDLLTLSPFRGIPILTPRAFLDHTWPREPD